MDRFTATGGRDALGPQTVRAATWAFIALVGGRAISVVALAGLARLLGPADFGLMAFALVFITYAETIGDLGTSAALIYWPDRDRGRDDVAQLTFRVSLIAGLAWFAISWIAAPWVAGFFHAAETTSILRALAWTFPLKALGSTHDALAQKDLRFRARFVPEIGLAAFKAAVSLALAVIGFGVWSLVFGHLAGVLAWTMLLWIVVPWRPRARVRHDLLGPVLSYGRSIVAVNMLAAVVHHSDVLVVGRMLGATALGLYQVAGRLPDVTLMMIVRVAGRVLFPAFAQVSSSREALRAAYLTALKYVALLVLPAAVVLIALAEPVVRIVFGPPWLSTVPILRALAVYAALRALGTHAGDVLKAAGRPGLLAGFGLLKAALIVPALVLAARVDATAVAATLAGVTLVTVLINLAIVSRVLALPGGAVVAAIAPAIACAGAMGLVLAAWLHAASAFPAVAILAGGAALGAGVFVGFLRLLTPEITGGLATTVRAATAGGGR